MPAFSYAQAARGLPQSKSEPIMRDESTEHEVQGTQLEEINASRGSSRPSRSRARDEPNESAAAAQKELTRASTDEVGQKESVLTSQPPRQASTARKVSTSSAASPDSTTGDAATRVADSASRRDQSSSWDQTSQTSTSAEKAQESTEKDKVKDSEDDWEKVSVPSVSAEKELKAAPVPTVNIWLQRKEAQNAKKQQVEPQKTSVSDLANPGIKSKPTTDESKTKISGSDAQDKATGRAPTDTEKARGGQDPSSIRAPKSASRPDRKGEGGAPPFVTDTMAWPTPENSLVEERRRSNVNEKTEKAEVRKEGVKAHSKWVQIPFVPTAKFETPLPPAAGKRGGRAGRGRGGHMPQSMERSEPTGAMGPPPLPNKAAEQDRGRKNDNDRSTRANSLPAANRRPASRESAIASLRKPSAPSKDSPVLHTPASSSKVSSTDPINGKSQTPSRSSSRQEQPDSVARTVAGYGTTVPQSTADTTDVFKDGTVGSSGRVAPPTERAPLPWGSSRPQGDYVREGRPQKTRDWSRDKTDTVNATEKVENWKDRDYSGESSSRRGERNERGRGSFRGARGGHPYSSYASGHSYTSPLPQNGFEVPKHGAIPADRSRQASQPYPYTTAAPNRNNPRSYSGPLNAGFQYYDNNTGMAQAMSPIQTDMSGYNLQGQMPMLSSPMSAAPFGSHLNSFGVMSMVMGQVEYYFSIDNLCKDIFLRKHMDSQGWVPLSVVADFKRVKTLIGDSQVVDTLRYVCQQIRTIEYLPGGEEGEDRLRRRDNWQDFVLPMSERNPSAQNDGPQLRQPSIPQLPNLSQFYGETTPFVPQHLRSPSTTSRGVNGTHSPAMSPPHPIPSLDGHISDRQNGAPYSPSRGETVRREQAVSPFSPHDLAALQATPLTPRNGGLPYMTNGHHRQSSRNTQDDNVFPDDRLTEINICVKSPGPEEKNEEQSLLSGVSRVLSNGPEPTGMNDATVSIPPRITGMRGGAGHPDQLARLQHVQFGSQPMDLPEQTPFYAKNGQRTSIPPTQPGQFFVSYMTFHYNAMQDRARGLPEAIEPMYNFWEKFLVDNFNVGLYEEFRDLAQQDEAQGNDSGKHHLFAYYQSALECSKPMIERVAIDLVGVLRNEQDEARPMFKMMRQAWRNGALDMKTRKRLADMLSTEEKAAFDKGG